MKKTSKMSKTTAGMLLTSFTPSFAEEQMDNVDELKKTEVTQENMIGGEYDVYRESRH
ncbi:hypothetical protein [Bacillus thuringiensis]|uniref:hypothetical protein n=1 Tax=Bacillus thuringiensis TaxID=1428 RepID=UPI0014838CD2|nr:hypothetical protein [Bacillus thuringiensis]